MISEVIKLKIRGGGKCHIEGQWEDFKCFMAQRQTIWKDQWTFVSQMPGSDIFHLVIGLDLHRAICF